MPDLTNEGLSSSAHPTCTPSDIPALVMEQRRSPMGELGVTGALQPSYVGDERETAVFFRGLELKYADSLVNRSVVPAEATAVDRPGPAGACGTGLSRRRAGCRPSARQAIVGTAAFPEGGFA